MNTPLFIDSDVIHGDIQINPGKTDPDPEKKSSPGSESIPQYDNRFCGGDRLVFSDSYKTWQAT